MLKYWNCDVVMAEVPDEVTLAINLTNCPCHCKGCHSSYLSRNIGKYLDEASLSYLINANKGITCVSFMGGDNDPHSVASLACYVKEHFDLKTSWYSGRENLPDNFNHKTKFFNFIKLGPYIEEDGPINKSTTNQRMYERPTGLFDYCKGIQGWNDITYKFWNK